LRRRIDIMMESRIYREAVEQGRLDQARTAVGSDPE
jgi:hypothetical protein